ncbi:MAG: twin-arginine translocase TatA/TatE family subunit [Flavobacteriales bacterium]|nr:twin-arginine translocase TatA/TatE family subunit [Flavobacteriales bacterium]
MNHLLFLEGLAFSEVIWIILIALILFGPKKLPEIARGLGEGVRKMKEATESIKQEIIKQTEDSSVKEIKEDIDKAKETIQEIEGTVKRKK